MWEENLGTQTGVHLIDLWGPLNTGFTVLFSNAVMLQRHIIQFTLYYLSNGSIRKVKNKREFQTLKL